MSSFSLRRTAAAGVLTVLVVGGLAGCSGSDSASTSASAPAPASSAAAQGPVASAVARPDSPQRVDVTQFADVVGQPGVTVVDVRTPAEFDAGHLDGAVNIDVEGQDFASQVAGLDPAGTYAVYCRSGNRSATAVAMMAEAGVTGTYDLDGGIVAWEAAGLPVVA